jgi:hypothetical protein
MMFCMLCAVRFTSGTLSAGMGFRACWVFTGPSGGMIACSGRPG